MSGFVPSFSSFPDLDSQESKDKRESKSHRDKDRHKDRDRRRPQEEEHRHRRRSRSRSPPREQSHKRHKHSSRKDDKAKVSSTFSGFEDDDKTKARQDRKERERKERETGHDTTLSKEFYVDKRGDNLNIKYGGLHSGDVPKFRRAGRGKVLGLSSVWNIARGSGNKEVETRRRDKPKIMRYSESKAMKILAEAPQQHIKIPSTPQIEYDDFIPISRTRNRRNSDPQDSYRRITEEEKEHSDSEASMSFSSDQSDREDDDEQRTLTAEQETIKSLESTLSRSSDDEEAWLRLLELSVRSLPIQSKRVIHARADISASLLERAINSHPNNKVSPRLRLLYVEAGSEFWPREKIEKEWSDIIALFDTSNMPPWKRCTVWVAYLEWRIASNRSVDGTLTDAERAMKSLQESRYEMTRVTILWRIAVFLRESGYLERALAIFQAQIELSYCCPPSMSKESSSSKLDQLEEFWEAEVPRIGEPSATGWAVWHASGQPTGEAGDGGPLAPEISNISDPYQLWYCREKALDQLGRIPTRSFDSEEGDPFSTILFSDIRSFITEIETERAKRYLKLAFLAFLGLKVPGIGMLAKSDLLDGKTVEGHIIFDDGWMMSGCGGWVTNPDHLFPPIENDRLIMWESHAGTTVAAEQPRKPSSGPVKDWVINSSLLYGTGINCERRIWEAADLDGSDTPYVSRVFAQLEALLNDEAWCSNSNAFEASLDVKRAVKLSKTRLESKRTSIPLWNDHAKLERIRGKIMDANKIYNMALTLNGDGADQSSKLVLTADAVEYFWLQDNRAQAEKILADACEIKGSFQGASLLRARKALEAHLSAQSQYSPSWEATIRLRFFLEFSASTLGAAIFSVISSLANISLNPSPSPSQSQSPASSDSTQNHVHTHESLTTWLCSIIFQLSQLPGIIVPQAIIAEQISSALKYHPDNTILLGLFLESERGQGIWGRVRSLLDNSDDFLVSRSSSGSLSTQTLSGSKSLSRIAWELWAEGWSYGPWEKERVRAKLELATRNSRTRRSIVLWRIYLAFQVRVQNLERAKTVLYRALGQCPWAKDLYLMAFGPLRPVFRSRELNELMAAMAERGIRMRDDLEAHLEGWMDPTMTTTAMELEDSTDQNAGDIELERFIKDREQAKPY